MSSTLKRFAYAHITMSELNTMLSKAQQVLQSREIEKEIVI